LVHVHLPVRRWLARQANDHVPPAQLREGLHGGRLTARS
jgi:hypothetical protein